MEPPHEALNTLMTASLIAFAVATKPDHDQAVDAVTRQRIDDSRPTNVAFGDPVELCPADSQVFDHMPQLIALTVFDDDGSK